MPDDEKAEAPARKRSRFIPCRGYRVHVYTDQEGETAGVWLNTEVSDFDGICLAAGCVTREAAIETAIDVLTKSITALKRAKARG
jgi:hypothetical protein